MRLPLLTLAFAVSACTMEAPSLPGVQTHALTAGDGPNGEQIVYLNFDGASVKRAAVGGTDDARLNEAVLPDAFAVGTSRAIAAFDPAPFAPTFTGTQAKDYVVQQVGAWLADFNVQLVTTRPVGARYTMIVIGDVSSQVVMGSSFFTLAGVASVDCANHNQNDVAFVFSASLAKDLANTDAARADAMKLIAVATAADIGSSFGLANVNDPADIMAAPTSTSATGFLSGARTLASAQSACTSGATTQDSHAQLLVDPGPAPSGVVHDFAVVGVGDFSTVGTPDLSTTRADAGETRGTKEVGDRCGDSSECADHGTCITVGKSDYCTVACDRGDATSCPAGYTCTDVEGDDLCVAATPSSSGCSIGGASSPPLAFLLLFVAALALLARATSAGALRRRPATARRD